MAFQVRKSFPVQAGKDTKRIKTETYLDWIRTLPCVVTGKTGRVQAAHVNYASSRWGAPGRGKQSKASDRWALPLDFYEHDKQHSFRRMEGDRSGEVSYWKHVGIDPHALACALWGLYQERIHDNERLALTIIRKARLL